MAQSQRGRGWPLPPPGWLCGWAVLGAAPGREEDGAGLALLCWRPLWHLDTLVVFSRLGWVKG